MSVALARATPAHRAPWLALRTALWPDADPAELAAELDRLTGDPARFAAWLAIDAAAGPVGLAEATLRHDHVNGCDTSPVAFLEALYVAPAYRRRGIARALSAAVAGWGRDRGALDYASDTRADDDAAQAVHAALGFTETERVVCFRQALAG